MNRNTKTLAAVMFAVVFMVGLSFAAVPMYNMFCKVTGFAGTPLVSESAPGEVLERTIVVKFNTDTARNFLWDFKPDAREVEVHVGQETLASFTAKSRDRVPTAGTAIYNVTPDKAGKYFHKTQCFCFDQQTLQPGQEANMPVVFYIDPSIVHDRNMDDVETITLSYSFFPAESKELEAAMEAFYNAGEAVIDSDGSTAKISN